MHNPHPSPRHALSKVLLRNTQQLADGLLMEPWGLTPPLAKLTTLALLHDQWMPQELINDILIEGDPLAPHPGALVSDSFLHGLGISVKLHDYFEIILSHECRNLSPLPPRNFLLKLGILSVPQLDLPNLEERPALNCLKSVLVFLTSVPMSVELHIHLWGCTRTFSGGIFPCPLSWELPWCHFLWGYICKVNFHEIPIITTKAKQTWKVRISFHQMQVSRAFRQQSHIGACAIFWYISIYMHIYIFFSQGILWYIYIYILKGILWCISMHIYILKSILWHISMCVCVYVYWKAFYATYMQGAHHDTTSSNVSLKSKQTCYHIHATHAFLHPRQKKLRSLGLSDALGILL